MATAGPWTDICPTLAEYFPPILTSLGFPTMTDVQREVIPSFLAHRDVRVSAPTGSGKTLAFLVPMLQLMHTDTFTPGIRGMVLAPSRPLAEQIATVANTLITALGWNDQYEVVSTIGGAHEDVAVLRARLSQPRAFLIVGTPGRTLELAEVVGRGALSNLAFFVMDEADMLLGAGGRTDEALAQQTRRLVELIPRAVHRGIFSATLATVSAQMGKLGQRNPWEAVVGGTRSLENQYVVCAPERRMIALAETLAQLAAERKAGVKILIFAMTRDMVSYVTHTLPTILNVAQPGLADRTSIVSMHGGLTKGAREEIIAAFGAQVPTEHGLSLMVTTDVVARGYDEPTIELVLQLDAPQDTAAFTHRCGRTARIGRAGAAILFLAPSEMPYLNILRDQWSLELAPRPVNPGSTPLVADPDALRKLAVASAAAAAARDTHRQAERRFAQIHRKEDRLRRTSATAIAESRACADARKAHEGAAEAYMAAEAVVAAAHEELQTPLFNNPVVVALRGYQQECREHFEEGQDAYRSWVAAYGQNRGDYKALFAIKNLDLGQIAIGYGLLALPRKEHMAEMGTQFLWFRGEGNVNELHYANKVRESARLARVEAAQERRATEAAAKEAKAQEGAEAGEGEQGEQQPERAVKKVEEQAEARAGAARPATDTWVDEFDDLGADLRALKRAKKNGAGSRQKMTREERAKARSNAKTMFADWD